MISIQFIIPNSQQQYQSRPPIQNWSQFIILSYYTRIEQCGHMLHNTSNNKIQVSLDLAMVILIAFASYTLIFQETQYRYFMILIMFGFLYYFIKFRLPNYSNSKPKYVIYQIDSGLQKKDGKKMSLNNSIFLQDFKKISFEKTKKQGAQQDLDKSKSNSYISYINRSKKANQSLSNNSGKPRSERDHGFDFLNNRSNGRLLSDSFHSRFKGMDDTYIRNVQANQDTREDINNRRQKIMKQCMARYRQTVSKLESQQKQIKHKIRNGYHKVKRICLDLTRQVYTQNIDNLKDIVLTLEQIYEVRINCREFLDLDRVLEPDLKKLDFVLEINLVDAIQKLIKSKDSSLNATQRKVKKVFNINNSVPDYYNRKSGTPSSAKDKLKSLVKERLRLNSYFYNQHVSAITVEKLIWNLKLLRQFDEEEQNEQSDYELRNYIKISQQYSQKMLLVFNVTRNRINNIISQYDYTLQFQVKSFLGWISKQSNEFEVVQTVNSDYGHPHYDVRLNKDPKETLYCEFGPQNGYSVLFMYFWALQKRVPAFVRANARISRIAMDCLDILIL